MKNRSILASMAVALGMSFGSAANAGVITDTVNQNVYVPLFGSHTYTHNINDNGFILGTAASGTLQISIVDDARDRFDIIPELVLVIVDSFDFDTGGLAFNAFNNALGLQAIGSLNQDGILQVKVQSLTGDFQVKDSVLTVETVPAPGPLMLFGAGLLALGIARRKAAR